MDVSIGKLETVEGDSEASFTRALVESIGAG